VFAPLNVPSQPGQKRQAVGQQHAAGQNQQSAREQARGVAQVQVAFDDRVKQQRGKEQVVHQRIDLAPNTAVQRGGAADQVAQ
jgi:hypothetical protein